MIKFIKISAKLILKKLLIVNSLITNKKPLPILENILIIKKKKKLYFIVNNLEIQIIVRIDINENYPDIYTTVSAYKFINILKKLPLNLKIFFNLIKNKLIIKFDNSYFSLQTINYINYPLIKESKKYYIKIIIEQEKIKKLFDKTYFIIPNQEINFSLNGLLLIIKKNKILVISTDTYRLILYKTYILNQNVKCKIIIPKKTILELKKHLKNKENVKIKISKKQINFFFKNIKFFSKTINSKFPEYKKIISYKYKNYFDINRLVLLNSLQRIYVITNDQFRGVYLDIKKNYLKIKSGVLYNEKAKEKLFICYNGKNIKIGFNINYLIDVLLHLKCKMIKINFNNSKDSILIEDVEDKNFKYIVMPMNI